MSLWQKQTKTQKQRNEGKEQPEEEDTRKERDETVSDDIFHAISNIWVFLVIDKDRKKESPPKKRSIRRSNENFFEFSPLSNRLIEKREKIELGDLWLVLF